LSFVDLTLESRTEKTHHHLFGNLASYLPSLTSFLYGSIHNILTILYHPYRCFVLPPRLPRLHDSTNCTIHQLHHRNTRTTHPITHTHTIQTLVSLSIDCVCVRACACPVRLCLASLSLLFSVHSHSHFHLFYLLLFSTDLPFHLSLAMVASAMSPLHNR
jgi:hypothetical protein